MALYGGKEMALENRIARRNNEQNTDPLESAAIMAIGTKNFRPPPRQIVFRSLSQ